MQQLKNSNLNFNNFSLFQCADELMVYISSLWHQLTIYIRSQFNSYTQFP